MSRWTHLARQYEDGRDTVPTSTGAPDPTLSITVIFTTVPGTEAAMEVVHRLSAGMGLKVTFLLPQVVPCGLPLSRPPVDLDHLRRVALSLIAEVCVNARETAIQIILCRDRAECLRQAIRACSLVVLGGRRSWWARSEPRLVRWLRSLGHEVVFVEAASVRQPWGKVPERAAAARSTDLRGEQACST